MTQATETNLEANALPTINGVPIGTILAYGGLVDGNAKGHLDNYGWLVCDGETVSREDYPELFKVIGSSFGGGDGVTNFNLPDLRGRFLRGVDAGAGRDPDAKSRTASADGGHTGDNVGSYQEDKFKAHSHSFLPKLGWQAGPLKEENNRPRIDMSHPKGDWSVGTDESGGLETCPKNIYVNWIIKAKDV
jgi:Phage Tail Collar Domain